MIDGDGGEVAGVGLKAAKGDESSRLSLWLWGLREGREGGMKNAGQSDRG